MKFSKLKYFKTGSGIFVMLILSLIACTDDFDQINSPPDELNANNISGPQIGQAFAEAQYKGMSGDRIGLFRCQFEVTSLWVQYHAQSAAYFNSDQLIDPGLWINSCWNTFYGDPAVTLQLVEQFTEENSMAVANAMVKVWQVKMFQQLTDLWGPIPYSEFGSGETSVAYDSQESIYKDFFTTLDEVVSVFEQNSGGSAFATDDQIYGGDADKWLTFANSLRLRLAMRISYVEPTLAQQEAEKAVNATGGVMMDNTDNAMMLTTPNSINWLAIWTYIDEFRMSANMESLLKGYEDPRLPNYFDEAEVGGGYHGFRNGLPASEKGNYLNTEHSFVDGRFLPLAAGGTNPPNRVMDASEVYFLRAEGALRGWNMGGTAEELYNDGIRMSLNDRTSASSSEIGAYINSTNTPVAPDDAYNSPPVTDIPVQYQAGADFETRLEQIITQKFLALWYNGWEAYTERRRTGYPRGYAVISSLNPSVAENELVRRRLFSSDERSSNIKAVEAAVELLDGPDEMTTRLWWDAKPLSDYPAPTDLQQ